MTLGTGTGLTGTLIPSSIVSSLCSVYITDLSVKHVPYDSLFPISTARKSGLEAWLILRVL